MVSTMCITAVTALTANIPTASRNQLVGSRPGTLLVTSPMMPTMAHAQPRNMKTSCIQ